MTMKTAVICTFFFVYLFAVTWAEESLSSRYDTLDIDAILKNDRVLTNYIKCLMGKGPCTTEGRSLKKDLPAALENNCENCTENQRKMVKKACRHIRSKRPNDWEKLLTKYDPAGKFKENIEKFLNEE